MTLNEYQQRAVTTAIYPGRGTFAGISYCTIKLNGEAGEVAEKVGKTIRDHDSKINDVRRDALITELGDVLWYVANLASELSVGLDVVAGRNLLKLQARKEHNSLRGEGDDR